MGLTAAPAGKPARSIPVDRAAVTEPYQRVIADGTDRPETPNLDGGSLPPSPCSRRRSL